MYEEQPNIKFIVRIRSPGTKDDSAKVQPDDPFKADAKSSKSPSTSGKKTPTSSSKAIINQNPTQGLSPNLRENVNYTIFTSTDIGNTLAVSNKPINGRILNQTIISESDITNFSHNIIRDADILDFDKIYNETQRLEALYNDNVKECVTNAFQGFSSCIMLFGPNDAGKSYTLRGEENHEGILGKTAKDLLNLMEISEQVNSGNTVKRLYGLKLSIYLVFNESVHDLINRNNAEPLLISKFVDKDSGNYFTKINDLKDVEIKNFNDYNNAVNTALQHRKVLEATLRVNDLKKKSNMIISFVVSKKEVSSDSNATKFEKSQNIAQIDFVELASSNYGLDPLQVDKSEHFSRVNANNFRSIKNNLECLSIRKKPKYESNLTLVLKNTLTANSQILFITCVLSTEDPPIESFNSLKFTTHIRNNVLNRLDNPSEGVAFEYEPKSEYNDSERYRGKMNSYEPGRDTSSRYNRDLGIPISPISSYDREKDNYTFKNRQKYQEEQKESGSGGYEYSKRSKINVKDEGADYRSSSHSGGFYATGTGDKNRGGAKIGEIEVEEQEEEFQTNAGGKYRKIAQNDTRNNNTHNTRGQGDRNPNREGEKETKELKKNNSINHHSKIDYASDYQSDEDIKKINFHRPKYQFYKNDRKNTNERKNTNDTRTGNVSQIPNEERKYNPVTAQAGQGNKVSELEKSIQDIENRNLEISRNLDNLRMEKSRMDDKSFYGNPNHNPGNTDDINKLKHENNILKTDNIMFKEELNMMTELNRRLDADLAKQRNRNLELAAEVEKCLQDRIQKKNEIDRLNEQIVHFKLQEHNINDHYNQKFITDNKIRELESDLRKVREEKQKYEVEAKILGEKYSETKKRFDDVEKENTFLKTKQNDEMMNFEARLEKMTKDIETLQRENNTLRNNETRLRQEVHNLETQRDNYRDKYQDTKLKNGQLTSKMTEIEEEVKVLMQEKMNDAFEFRREEEVKKANFDKKQKIIKDMQDRVMHYKNEIMRSRTSRKNVNSMDDHFD